MYITYARSSSLNTLEFCPQSYFLTYNLGLTKFNPPNKKTIIGTMTHKVLEVLALCKKEFQDTSADFIKINDVDFGEVSVSYDEFVKMCILTPEEVDIVNNSRINKDIYNGEYFIKYNHIRYGRDFVNSLILRSYDLYKHLNDNWEKVDFKTVINMVWMALDFDNGRLDPRFQTIKEAERHFDIKIEKSWAKYNFSVDNREICGTFSIKGTIDLLVEEDKNTLVIQDYKTGKRLDWNTNPPSEKTFEKLSKDKQLMLYFYAASILYPEYETIKVRIFFIRAGGDFLITFNKKKDLDKLESILKEHFDEVRLTEVPALISEDHSDMKCKYLCGFYKNKFPGTNKRVCDFIHEETVNKGIPYVVNKYADSSFTIGDYQEPGSK